MKKGLLIGLLTLVLLLLSVVSVAAEGGRVHYVRPGESLSSIAVLYGVTAQALMKANGLSDPDYIYAGQRLTIPSAGDEGGYQGDYYTVRPGDTLSSIAGRLNTTVQALVTANKLGDADAIYAGQRLKAPGGQGRQPAYGASSYERCRNYYLVRWGDSLSGIAWKQGTTVEAISSANNLSGDNIYEGQKLCLPGAGDAGQKRVIPGYQPQADPQKSTRPDYKEPTPAKPDYTPPDDPQDKNECSDPVDVWVRKDQATVEAINTWCPMFDFIDDPDGMTSIVVRTTGREGAVVKIQRGNEEPIQIITGSSPGFDADMVWYPTSIGYYRLWVEAAEPSAAVEFDLSGGKRAWVDFKLVSVSKSPRPRTSGGWSGRVARNDSQTTPQNGVSSVIIIRAPAQGLPIRIKAEGEFTALCYTGQKPEYGPGACEFGGLWPGKYTLTLEGSGAAVEVFVDGVGTAEVIFDRQ